MAWGWLRIGRGLLSSVCLRSFCFSMCSAWDRPRDGVLDLPLFVVDWPWVGLGLASDRPRHPTSLGPAMDQTLTSLPPASRQPPRNQLGPTRRFIDLIIQTSRGDDSLSPAPPLLALMQFQLNRSRTQPTVTRPILPFPPASPVDCQPMILLRRFDRCLAHRLLIVCVDL